jgi:hypothetical protein
MYRRCFTPWRDCEKTLMLGGPVPLTLTLFHAVIPGVRPALSSLRATDFFKEDV